MPAEPNTMIEMLQNLGFGMSSLAFSAWLIVWLLRSFERERQVWIDKDSASDLRVSDLLRENSQLQQATTEKLANLQAASTQQLLAVHEKLNTTLTAMTVAISELKQTIEKSEAVRSR
jgi:hypothetical protein